MNRATPAQGSVITLDKLVQSNLVDIQTHDKSPLRPGGIQPPPVKRRNKRCGHFTEGGVTRMI